MAGWLDVPADDLARLAKELRTALEATRRDWPYSVSSAYARDLVGYWCDGYDWPAHENRLNSHRLIRLGGHPHLHIRTGPVAAALPVYRREWPDTVLDVLDGADHPVDVLVPLIPWLPDSTPIGNSADQEAIAEVRVGPATSSVRRLAAGLGLLGWHAQLLRHDLDRDRIITEFVLTFFGPGSSFSK